MHAAALAFLAAHLPRDAGSVLEFGSRNINGSARSVCAAAKYVGVDIEPGPGVDIVADAALVDVAFNKAGELMVGEVGNAMVEMARGYHPQFDAVVCAEVFEHTDDDNCVDIIVNAAAHLRSGGMFIATMAGLGRNPHSAADGGPLHDGEFYRNVDHALLESWLNKAGFESWTIDVKGDDIRCTAVKP